MKFNIPKKFNLDRKLRKLQKNPELFFKDLIVKRTNQFKKNIPIKYQGKHQFTIVSAVYNVEKYLDDYFESITTQSLKFKEHIFIICVDDGSTDSSATIIKKWQNKYPKNIQYIYKKNGGQASARNLGLNLVKTEWLTYIDPDDFLNVDFFYEIEQALSKSSNIKMLVPNQIFYFDQDRIFKDTHTLKYRFQDKDPVINAQDLKDNIHLHAASTIFSTSIIKKGNLIYDDRIKPNFEDGKFIADYLLLCPEADVTFLKKSIYYYRKRSDGSSTLDKAWQSDKKYHDVIKYGYLPMFEDYISRLGYIPKFIQRTVLYDMVWYIRTLVDHDEITNFLSEEQKNNFKELMHRVFEYIDEKTILEFNLIGTWLFHKLGMLGLFKKSQPNFQIAYIEGIDHEKKQILIMFFSYPHVLTSFKINNQDTIPRYIKNINHTFLSEFFIKETRAWVPFNSQNDSLSMSINHTQVSLSLSGKQFKSISYKDVYKHFSPPQKYQSKKIWLLIDRDMHADDNAEHLYRYIQKNHPKQTIYFALRKDSHDWHRLELENFNLINFGSAEFESILRSSEKIISSFFDSYIINYFGDYYSNSKKFIFLQHGVTKDNMSHWFNNIKNMHMLVTSTLPEYNSIIKDDGSYKISKKEVRLTGFPRHDALLEHNKTDNVILIMPTWRSKIVGQTFGKGNTRYYSTSFMETDYAKHWYAILHHPQLKALSEQYKYQIIFAPHTNIEPYLNDFNIPSFIKVWNTSQRIGSIQALFQNSKFLITDYSSIAFEMAYLGKTTLYYQFDRDNFFNGAHTYQKGYFDYEHDGFGPVVTTETQLLKALEKLLKNNGQPNKTYLKRMKETFPFKDGKNCERVYQAILELDIPETIKIDLSILKQYIENAELACDWELLKSRSLLLIEHGEASDYPYAERKLAKALVNLNDSKEWYKLIPHNNTCIAMYNKYYSSQWDELHALLDKKNINQLDIEEKMYYLECCSRLKTYSEHTEKVLSSLLDDQISEVIKTMANVWCNMAQQNWKNAKTLLLEVSSHFDNLEWQAYRPYLILARISHYISSKEVDFWLNRYAEKNGKDTYFYLELINIRNV